MKKKRNLNCVKLYVALLDRVNYDYRKKLLGFLLISFYWVWGMGSGVSQPVVSVFALGNDSNSSKVWLVMVVGVRAATRSVKNV